MLFTLSEFILMIEVKLGSRVQIMMFLNEIMRSQH